MWPFHTTITLSQSGLLKEMADCHSHLLPGVDDGVQSLAESLRILSEMEQQGVRKLWLTPHVMEDVPNETAFLREQFREMQQQYQGPIRLELAAEYMLDNLFAERLEKDDLLPLQEGRRYLLVETSYFNPPMRLLPTLCSILQKGYFPLLAHPERYVYMQRDDYRTLKEEQISFQLNLPSLTGLYGKAVQEKAEWLLKSGMYDRFGCDTHSLTAYTRLLQSPLRKKLTKFLNQ